MSQSLADHPDRAHPLLPEMRPRMAKANGSDVRKAERADWRARIGHAIDRTRTLCELSLKEYAVAIGRDERQVARWIAGTERPQLDAIFAVDALRAALVIALAETSQDIDVITEIRVHRRMVS